MKLCKNKLKLYPPSVQIRKKKQKKKQEINWKFLNMETNSEKLFLINF